MELSRSARVIYDTPTYGNPVEVLTVVAAMYFIPSYALSLLAQRLEAGPERRAILAADTATATIAPAPASRPE